jgi:elongation factor P
MILSSEFKRGTVLMLDGAPHVIEHGHSSGAAQAKPKVHARLRHLKTGRVVERLFADNERATVADLETRRVQFSYHQADEFVFLDAETFDEVDMTAEQVGERRWFLKENEEYKAMFLESRLLDIVLPDHVALAVVETAAPQKGGSQAAYKTAKLEGGLEVMVPLFIAPGEVICVDTRDRKYLGKENVE